MAISASYGPMEIALRPRYEDLTRLLARLQPVEGLQTTRQVGTSQAYLATGLRSDGTLARLERQWLSAAGSVPVLR